MRHTRPDILSLLALLTLFVATSVATAAGPTLFASSKPKKVDADPKKDYYLTESDGAWFIMAKKFSGDNAALNAKRLAYELRAAFNLESYVFIYDPDQMEMDALSRRLGETKKFHYQTARMVEYAVLVGGYPTGEDLELQKTLEKIRKLNPRSLQKDPQSIAQVEGYKRGAQFDSRYAGYGPLGAATPVPNPLMPIEFFNHKGVVDPFIAKLNSDSKYSLLNNKRMYTVRVATFTGDASIKNTNDSFDELNSRLQYAGIRAAAMCEALRNKGVEAWEFHDHDCSFVTIGGFDKYGTVQPDGHIELVPQVAEIMQKFGGELVDDGSGNSKYNAFTLTVDVPDPSAKGKKRRMQLSCDVRPVIIVVPQRSGEENVRKIALAQEQMLQARQRTEATMVEASLAEAERDLEGAKLFAETKGRALSEEEWQAFMAQSGQSGSTPAGSATQERYSAQATNGANVASAANPGQERQARVTPTTANPNAPGSVAATPAARPATGAAPAQPRANAASAAPRTNNATAQTGARPAAPVRSAQRASAPTY
ncbi:MAG: hypothetical protein Q4G03_09430 [Planctomycetia bacterium]|nr:hypothetical protein [Planctomycetia bacterium]